MKKYFIILIILLSTTCYSGEGSSGGGGSLISADSLQINPLKDYSSIDLLGQIDFPVKLGIGSTPTLTVTNPLMINTIIMNNGFDISYPEKGMVIMKKSIDSVLLNNGQTLKLDMTNINSINLLR